ncbi:MAG: sigma-70 family RNA polymerase sigma factor [Gemmataceae bacterium]|nr:sigma-70 family RNA polymerase sigma factor [Gemmataceae bacterium]
MRLGPVSRILHRLGRRSSESAGEASDGQLLERFALGHEEGAFAALMSRHGPMVLSVCRRILPHSGDVEDAFQATFLMLIRKAQSIRKQSSVAGWLYRVAYHAAIRTRTDAARRQAREQRVLDRPAMQPSVEAAWRELQAVLDEELERLPEKYRAPLVLCYIEGKTHDEAAQQLGWPQGTVKGRLARARDLLRARLTRRGLGPVAGSFAAVLAVSAPAHALPAPLAAMAAQMAAQAAKGLAVAPQIVALVNGLSRTLLLAKLKSRALLVLTCVFLGLVVVGGGLLARELWGTTDSQGDPKLPVAGPIIAPAPVPPVALDRFGDALPQGALTRMGTVRLRLGSPVYRFAYTRNGQMLAAGSDRNVILWKADTGAEARQLIGHENRVLGIAFSPDGLTLASSSVDQTIRLWDLVKGVELRRLEGHQGTVGAIAFSPDGRTLVSGSADKTLRVWDVDSGKEVRRLGDETLPGVTWPVAFFSDNRSVATRDQKDALRLWDAVTGQELIREWLPQRVTAVAFSADGTKMIAARAGSPIMQLFDVALGTEMRQFRGHRGTVDSLVFSPDEKTLASSSADGTIRFWDVATAQEQCRAITGQHNHSGLVFSPDGATLAAGWDTMLRLWDTRSGKELSGFGHRGQVRSVAFLPHAQTLVSTGSDKTVRFWEIATGQEQSRWDGPVQDPAALAFAFAADGTQMAAGCKDRSIHVRDLATGKLLHQCRGHTDFISALAYAPDSRTLVSASWDKTLALWDAATGQELGRLRGHPNEIMAVAFAPDGKLVASGSTDGTLRIWDIDTGKTIQQCGGDLGWIRGLAFSPDGKTVAAASGVHGVRGKQGLLSLWDVATGEQRARWEAHAERVYCVAFSPDGALLATGGGDHKIRLWDPASGGELAPLEGHRGAVVSLAFSRDGRRLASGSMDTTALVWTVANETTGSR